MKITSPDSSKATPFIITATLPPGSLPASTLTDVPAAQVPTLVLHEGTTTTQVNVRAEPSTAGAPTGLIGPANKVQVIGKDPSGNWIQIIFSQASNGKGWLTARYVDVKDMDSLPIIGGGNSSEPTGAIMLQVNVRSGPGTDFDTLGVLNPKDVVSLTGKDPSSVWLQISYTGAPDGKAWVTAAYVQASDLEMLPVIGGTGVPLNTGTPTGIPLTITPTRIVALPDHDSPQSPAANITFSSIGTRSLIFSSYVSTPSGDPEDWIQFTPYTSSVLASLNCIGNGSIGVELIQAERLLQNWGSLSCGETKKLDLPPNKTYLMHRFAVSQGSELVSVRYTINIETTN